MIRCRCTYCGKNITAINNKQDLHKSKLKKILFACERRDKSVLKILAIHVGKVRMLITAMNDIITRGFTTSSSSLHHYHNQLKSSKRITVGHCKTWLFMWIAIFSDPYWKSMYLANGHPLMSKVPDISPSILTSTISNSILSVKTTQQVKVEDTSNLIRRQEESDPVHDSNVPIPNNSDVLLGHDFIKSFKNPFQDIASLNRLVSVKLTPRRRKKGLSYLSKYYSQSVLNNSSSQQFFGVSSGGGGSSHSVEQRYPSIRQKLSFYPPIATHTLFMAPWSRLVGGGGGRSSNMRLRWGK